MKDGEDGVAAVRGIAGGADSHGCFVGVERRLDVFQVTGGGTINPVALAARVGIRV